MSRLPSSLVGRLAAFEPSRIRVRTASGIVLEVRRRRHPGQADPRTVGMPSPHGIVGCWAIVRLDPLGLVESVLAIGRPRPGGQAHPP